MSELFDETEADCAPDWVPESLEYYVVFAWIDPADTGFVYLGRFQVEALSYGDAHEVASRCLDDRDWLNSYVFGEVDYIDDIVIGDVVVYRSWYRQLN